MVKKKKYIKDVHTEHCCIIHGCKYGEDDFCTVVTKRAPQSFPCETCYESGTLTVGILNKVIKKKIKRCPHCGHVL